MKRLLSALLCLCLLLTALIVPVQAEEAKIATDDTTGLENFWTLKGASLRLGSVEVTRLRFETVFEKAYLDGLIEQHGKENVQVGTIVTPLNNLKKAGRVFTVEALEATGLQDPYKDSKACLDAPLYTSADTYTFAGYSDEISGATVEYAAIGYVRVKGEITYSPTYTFRSASSVSTQAALDLAAEPNEEYAYPVMRNSYGNIVGYSCYSDGDFFNLAAFIANKNEADRVWNVVPKISQEHLRVVSSNVYFHCFKKMRSEDEKMARVNLLANTLANTGADVLLLQEVSNGYIGGYDFNWQKRLFPVLKELGYTLVDVELDTLGAVALKKFNRPDVNYTPIFYNAEKLILKDCGHNFYDSVETIPDSYLSSSKSYTWALFEEKATGKQFIAISTHMTYHEDPTDANTLRVQDAKEVAVLKTKLEADYPDVPMMIMGDLNCTSSSEPFSVLTAAGFKNSKILADLSVNASFQTAHSVGYSSGKGDCIDHALVSGKGIDVRLYQTYLSQDVLDMSDHIPVGIDFVLQ